MCSALLQESSCKFRRTSGEWFPVHTELPSIGRRSAVVLRPLVWVSPRPGVLLYLSPGTCTSDRLCSTEVIQLNFSCQRNTISWRVGSERKGTTTTTIWLTFRNLLGQLVSTCDVSCLGWQFEGRRDESQNICACISRTLSGDQIEANLVHLADIWLTTGAN